MTTACASGVFTADTLPEEAAARIRSVEVQIG
jgi:hypothetical protein